MKKILFLYDTASSRPTLTADDFHQVLPDVEIVSLDVRDEAKIRKVKEYWCLLSKALPGTEESKRKVLHATDLDAALRLIREMAK